MSKRVYELFIFDVYIAILKIEKVSSSFDDAESLKHDFMAWDSVIREFEIIGEASNILIKNNFLSKDNQVVVDFRNLLIHHYFGIDCDEVWDVVKTDLCQFKIVIEDTISLVDKSLKEELIDAMISENSHLSFVVDALKSIK